MGDGTMKKEKQDLVKIDRSKHKKKALHNGRLIDKDKLDAVDKERQDIEKNGLRQPTLPGPGMANTIHKNVDASAQMLRDAKEEVASANLRKKLCDEDLIRQMKKVGLTQYVNRGLNIEVLLGSHDRVTVRQYNHREDVDEDLTT
jgi:hypothetical protein